MELTGIDMIEQDIEINMQHFDPRNLSVYSICSNPCFNILLRQAVLIKIEVLIMLIRDGQQKGYSFHSNLSINTNYSTFVLLGIGKDAVYPPWK